MSLGLLLKKLLSMLLLPPLMPLLWIAAGLLLLRKHPRWGAGLAWVGLLLTLLLTIPAAVNQLTAPLEDVPVLQSGDLGRGQAIVILGAGLRRHMPEYGGPTPNRLALERLRYGARLARSSRLPVLLSGGAPTGYLAEAVSMAATLRADFGVEPRWLEVHSLDTAGNASHSASILQAEGIRRIVLVTHAAHMRRARGEFEAQGFDVIPAPTAFLTEDSTGERFFDYMPEATAAYAGWYALHEWVGLLAQRLRQAVR
jgi:uncharacterized SAM-binding protein YcdF (DUF218 family)